MATLAPPSQSIPATRSVSKDMARIEKRRYRKVICRMYADDKFLQLSRPQPNAQTLWLYLITGPHTTSVPGLFQAGEAQLAEALMWPVKGFRSAWLEIEALGMARADWQARVVWLPKAIYYNVPESPNVVRGWRHSLDEIPACALKGEALFRLHAYLKGLGEAFAKAFGEAFGEGSAFPSPNQEQEQEQDLEDPPTPHADARGASPRLTRALRKQIDDILRIRFGRCVHDPSCENRAACVLAVAAELQGKAARAEAQSA